MTHEERDERDEKIFGIIEAAVDAYFSGDCGIFEQAQGEPTKREVENFVHELYEGRFNT